MREEDSFLRAILEAPGDPTPALIFADWLEERGDPRAEIVRIRCTRLHPLEPLREGSALHRRLQQLADVHGDPLEGMALLRGEIQRCRLFFKGWLRRVWELSGPVTARVEFRAWTWESVWVNDTKAASAVTSLEGVSTLPFNLPAAPSAQAVLSVAYSELLPTFAGLELTVEGIRFYREGEVELLSTQSRGGR